MSKRLALNINGEMTYCSASDENIGKGRCNHLEHQRSYETPQEFMDRVKNLDGNEMKKIKKAKSKNIKPGVAAGTILMTLLVALNVAAKTPEVHNFINQQTQQIKNIHIPGQSSYKEKQENVKGVPTNTENPNLNESYNSRGYTSTTQKLINGIQVKELSNTSYERDNWGGDVNPSYLYKDPQTGRTFRTNSNNRSGFYDSQYYDDKTHTYTDPYDPTMKYTQYAGTGALAKRLNQPDNVNFDHIIPLSYVSRAIGGDSKWSQQKRDEFAYNLNIGATVSQHLNNVKGAKGPAEFLPPNHSAQIRYLYSWLTIANEYNIPIAPADMKVIKDKLKNADKKDLTPINPYKSGTKTLGTSVN